MSQMVRGVQTTQAEVEQSNSVNAAANAHGQLAERINENDKESFRIWDGNGGYGYIWRCRMRH